MCVESFYELLKESIAIRDQTSAWKIDRQLFLTLAYAYLFIFLQLVGVVLELPGPSLSKYNVLSQEQER